MIVSVLQFFQIQGKNFVSQSIKLTHTLFRITLEIFYTIYMRFFTSEFVCAIKNSIMAITVQNQFIIGFPFFGVDAFPWVIGINSSESCSEQRLNKFFHLSSINKKLGFKWFKLLFLMDDSLCSLSSSLNSSDFCFMLL